MRKDFFTNRQGGILRAQKIQRSHLHRIKIALVRLYGVLKNYDMKKVVVTGIGAITPLGNDPAAFWSQLVAGSSGAGPFTHFNAWAFKTRFACEVKNFDVLGILDRSELKGNDLVTQYALVAAEQAIKDSGLDCSGIEPFGKGGIWG